MKEKLIYRILKYGTQNKKEREKLPSCALTNKKS